MKGKEISMQSKQRITDSLLLLMNKKDYSKITIKEISIAADVARLTFYRNFSSKENILIHYLQELFDDYKSTIKNDTSLIEALASCFEYWHKKGYFTMLLIKNNLEYILLKPFHNYVGDLLDCFHLSNDFTKNQREFITGGLFFSMLQYIIGENSKDSLAVSKEILSMLHLC